MSLNHRIRNYFNEPTTPLNDADHGGSFYADNGSVIVFRVSPPSLNIILSISVTAGPLSQKTPGVGVGTEKPHG